VQYDFGINSKHYDLDLMYYSTNICALPLHWPVSEAYFGEIKRICTHDVHPGYARQIGDTYCEEIDIYMHTLLIFQNMVK